MNERLELLRSIITPEVRRQAGKLANERLLTGVTLVKKGDIPQGKRRGILKVALIMCHMLNPFEKFGAEEEALLRGVSSDTVIRHRNELKKL